MLDINAKSLRAILAKADIRMAIAYEPVEKNRVWSVYSVIGGVSPVKRLALNLGMLGDRKDSKGRLC